METTETTETTTATATETTEKGEKISLPKTLFGVFGLPNREAFEAFLSGGESGEILSVRENIAAVRRVVSMNLLPPEAGEASIKVLEEKILQQMLLDEEERKGVAEKIGKTVIAYYTSK